MILENSCKCKKAQDRKQSHERIVTMIQGIPLQRRTDQHPSPYYNMSRLKYNEQDNKKLKQKAKLAKCIASKRQGVRLW